MDATIIEMATEPAATPRLSAAPSAATPNSVGLVLTEIAAAEREALGIEYGLRVETIGGVAEDSRLRRGDVIVAVNGARFNNHAEFEDLVSKRRANGVVALLIKRGDAMQYVPLKLG